MTCTPNKNDILTHVLFNHYSSPSGFSFDFLSGDEEIDFLNVDKKSTEFVKYF